MNTYTVDKNQEEFSLKNQAIVRNKTQDYAKVTRNGAVYYLSIAESSRVDEYKVGLSGPQVRQCRQVARGSIMCFQREWLQVALRDPVQLVQWSIPKHEKLVGTISLEVDFYQKPK